MMQFWAESSFREKSGWVMGGLIAALGIWYFAKLGAAAWHPGGDVPAGLLLRFVFASIIGSIVVQIALVTIWERDADAPADEREQQVKLRAGQWSGLVLGAGAITALIMFPVHGDGVVLFHGVMASLILSEVMENIGTAWLLRRGF